MKILNIYSWLDIESYAWTPTWFLHVTISFQYVKSRAILHKHVDSKTAWPTVYRPLKWYTISLILTCKHTHSTIVLCMQSTPPYVYDVYSFLSHTNHKYLNFKMDQYIAIEGEKRQLVRTLGSSLLYFTTVKLNLSARIKREIYMARSLYNIKL
jgi:hypothetical protein